MLLCSWIDRRQLNAVPICFKSNKNIEYIYIIIHLKDNHCFTMIEIKSVIFSCVIKKSGTLFNCSNLVNLQLNLCDHMIRYCLHSLTDSIQLVFEAEPHLVELAGKGQWILSSCGPLTRGGPGNYRSSNIYVGGLLSGLLSHVWRLFRWWICFRFTS